MEPTNSWHCTIKVEVMDNMYNHMLSCTCAQYNDHTITLICNEVFGIIRRMEFYIILSASSLFSLSSLLPILYFSLPCSSEASVKKIASINPCHLYVAISHLSLGFRDASFQAYVEWSSHMTKWVQNKRVNILFLCVFLSQMLSVWVVAEN